MTDREQIRRDAEEAIKWGTICAVDPLKARVGRRCLALLTELEQAERGWEAAWFQGGEFMRRAHEAEARLAQLEEQTAGSQ